jgi:hypothetical protein
MELKRIKVAKLVRDLNEYCVLGQPLGFTSGTTWDQKDEVTYTSPTEISRAGTRAQDSLSSSSRAGSPATAGREWMGSSY